jgi:hypothetical protein
MADKVSTNEFGGEHTTTNTLHSIFGSYDFNFKGGLTARHVEAHICSPSTWEAEAEGL